MRRTRWEDGAACTDMDPELFFEVENAVDEHRLPDPLKVAEALSACRRCPIHHECRDVGDRTRAVGIWGGRTAAERGLVYVLPRSSRRNGDGRVEGP